MIKFIKKWVSQTLCRQSISYILGHIYIGGYTSDKELKRIRDIWAAATTNINVYKTPIIDTTDSNFKSESNTNNTHKEGNK